MPRLHPTPDELDPIERASRDEIYALQLKRLKATLKHVYENVPHYRAAFDAKGVRPEDLKELQDLAKFPFTGKKDLRDAVVAMGSDALLAMSSLFAMQMTA